MPDFEWTPGTSTGMGVDSEGLDTGATGQSDPEGDGDGDGNSDAGDDDDPCPESHRVDGWPGCWWLGSAPMTCELTCEVYGRFDAVASRHTGAPIAAELFPDYAVLEPLLPVECVDIPGRTVRAATGELPTGEEWSERCGPLCACST